MNTKPTSDAVEGVLTLGGIESVVRVPAPRRGDRRRADEHDSVERAVVDYLREQFIIPTDADALALESLIDLAQRAALATGTTTREA
jgi:hypothetical protein